MSDLVQGAIERLKAAHVSLRPGLSEAELARLEERYDFSFAPDHRELLATALPSGDAWVDWREGAEDGVEARLAWPVDGVVFDVRNNGFWPSSWGDRPSDQNAAEQEARRRLATSPRLVPIYSHRYVAAGADYLPSVVLSVYQTDVIYYGDNLLDYVAHEFNVPPLQPTTRRPHVPFWSDLAEGREPSNFDSRPGGSQPGSD